MIFRKFICFCLCLLSYPVMSRESVFLNKFKDFIEVKDYVGARIYFKKNYNSFSSADEWLAVRSEMMRQSQHTGFDLVYSMDRKPAPGLLSGSLDVNTARFNADQLMLGGKFLEAFDVYQKIALELKSLKKISRSNDQKFAIDFLSPYIFQSMGRALYGAKRYDESFIVYRWIPQSFSKIREVQFEKMWAAFRGGRVDQALGAIASQSSAYFNSYLPPEAYLVQTYLYKKLCRTPDYNSVLNQMRGFLKDLDSGKYSTEVFSKSDMETIVLWNLTQSQPELSGSGVTSLERDAEKRRIGRVLDKAFENTKVRLRDDIEKALAYVQLTVRSGNSGVLRNIEKLPDRQTLFKLGLETWPADSKEEWIDEIGTHRFVGESLCKAGS